MLASILYFLGSLFNVLVDTIFKTVVWLVVITLSIIAICIGFAVLFVQLIT